MNENPNQRVLFIQKYEDTVRFSCDFITFYRFVIFNEVFDWAVFGWPNSANFILVIFGVYFLISNFLAESLKANKNWQKRWFFLQYCVNQKTSLILRTSTQKYTPTIQPKIHSLYKFSSKHVSGWCQKKILHCTISRHPRNAFSELFVRKFLFHRRRKLVSDGGMNDFLKTARCLGFVRFCFKISDWY